MFHIGEGGFRWYSFFALVGYLIAFLMMVAYIKRKYRLEAKIAEKAAFILIPLSLLGARIWYVLFNTNLIKEWYDVIAVWDGGLAIQGGIIFGSIAGFFIFWKLCKEKKDVLRYTDCILPFILIGQAIGRWGNFFNMEILGQPVEASSVENLGILADFLHYSFDVEGVHRFPLFLLQFFLNIMAVVAIIGIIPIFIDVVNKPGILASSFFILSGLIRASLELERSPVDIMTVNGEPISFIVAILFIIFGLGWLILLCLEYWKKITPKIIINNIKNIFNKQKVK